MDYSADNDIALRKFLEHTFKVGLAYRLCGARRGRLCRAIGLGGGRFHGCRGRGHLNIFGYGRHNKVVLLSSGTRLPRNFDGFVFNSGRTSSKPYLVQ